MEKGENKQKTLEKREKDGEVILEKPSNPMIT